MHKAASFPFANYLSEQLTCLLRRKNFWGNSAFRFSFSLQVKFEHLRLIDLCSARGEAAFGGFYERDFFVEDGEQGPSSLPFLFLGEMTKHTLETK